jgi:hypothetical protein
MTECAETVRGATGGVRPARELNPPGVGFQKSAWACDLRRSAFHAAGMITDVSLRLLYLILDRFLGWLMLLGRATSSKDQRRPKTSSSSCCATRSRYFAEPTPSPASTGSTELCSPC